MNFTNLLNQLGQWHFGHKLALGLAIGVPVTAIAVTFGVLRYINHQAWKRARASPIAHTVSERHTKILSKVQASAPRSASADGQPRFGLYLEPIARPHVDCCDLSFPFYGPFKAWRHKKWHFHSLETNELFMTMAVLHAGYASKAVVLLHRKKDGASFVLDETTPLSLGLQSFAESSIDPTTPTEFKFGPNHLKFAYNGTVWSVQGHVILKSLENPKEKHSCNFTFTVANTQKGDQFSLVYPLTPSVAAYTHKAMCLESEGILEFGQTPYYLNSSNVGLDWSSLYAPYLTRWNWLFVSGLTSAGVSFGLNLSNVEHYGDRENVLWIAGKANWVGPVSFLLPELNQLEAEKDLSSWTVVSQHLNSDAHIQLKFTPIVKKFALMNTGVIDSRYLQSLGHVTGTIKFGNEEHGINAILGIGERQLCFW